MVVVMKTDVVGMARSSWSYARRRLWVRLVALSSVLILGGALAAASPSPATAAGGTVILVVPPGATTPSVPYDYLATNLSDAQQLVRQHNSTGNVTVELATASYSITQPLNFGTADGGQNGYYVTWQAAPGATPVISGGEPVTGWTLYNAASNIWQASVAPGLNSRNLDVNGVEAPIAGSPIAGSPAATSSSWTITSNGFTITNATLASTLDALPDQSHIEIEHRGTWTDHYCPVSSIVGTTLTMAQPCWENNTMGYDTGSSTSGDYIENSLAYLNKPTEWYLNSQAGVLYYEPPAGTSPSSLNIQLPLVETLLDISGSYSNPVANLIIQGLEFENSSWLAPSSPSGYADQQQNYYLAETSAAGYPTFNSCRNGCSLFEATRGHWNEVPGAIQVSAATGVTFADDTFTDLGSAALGIGEDAVANASGVGLGAQNITLANNTFTQIAASGIMIGGIQAEASHPTNPLAANQNIVVENNHITATGTNYLDSDGVQTNNTTHAEITHNQIDNIPYDGIGTGFGWGFFDPGGSQDYSNRGTYNYYPVPTAATPQNYNNVTDNLIYSTGKGTSSFSCCAGPFYNLSASPFSVVSGNYMYANNPGQGGLYNDEGTRFLTFVGNVIQDATSWAGVNSSSTNNADDNLFYGNWHNHSATVNSTTGTGSPHYNVVFANPLIPGTAWPPAAQQVIGNAGLASGLGYPAPTITTLNQATMTVGSSGSYTVFASGSPTPSIAEAGTLPSGVTFTDNGNGTATFAGTPVAGSAGVYPISLTAANGPGSTVTQAFALTVLAQGPTATTVTITGRVTSASTGLPLGNVCAYLYFNPTAATPGASACTSANGSYEMDGVVPGPLQLLDTYHYLVKLVDPAGTYTSVWYNGTPAGAQTEATGNAIQLEGRLNTAVTGIDAVMPVNQAPSITSAASLTAALSVPFTFVMQASGSPWASFAETGALPSGVTFVSEGDGTALLSGTPASSSAGTYVITVTASNGISPAATQTFTLTIAGPTTTASVALRPRRPAGGTQRRRA